MKPWKKMLVRKIARRYALPVAGWWHHSPVRVLDRANENRIPHLYSKVEKAVVRKGKRSHAFSGMSLFVWGDTNLEIRVGKNWLKTQLTAKQFASYAIDRMNNGNDKIYKE